MFLQSYADSGILRTCWQMAASPTQKEAIALYCKRLFSHRWPGVGRIIRKLHPFWVAKPLSGRDCREDTFQGVWGQPTCLHRWMTVRRWAMCLLGAFCSGRNAYERCRRNIWCILGGEAIQLVLLDQCQCADFAIELATSADVNWCQLITFRSDRRLLVNEQAAGTMSQWHWMILVYNF